MRMSSAPTVFVYEFFTGGGCSPGKLPEGLADEALGMLWALLADFRIWGGVRTIAALDPCFENRIAGLSRKTLPADEVVSVSHGRHEVTYLSLIKRCDAVLVVAPETGGALSKLTSLVETAGVPLLGSSAAAAAAAGDKGWCGRIFRRAGLPIPETKEAGFAAASEAVRKLNLPLVIKPVDGVGSEGIFLLRNPADLSSILAKVRRTTSQDRILLQTLAVGIPVSVSLLVCGNRCLPLSLNRQLVQADSPFIYRGSRVPFHHKKSAHALELACKSAALIPGLKGYVGVDLVLSQNGACLIEINPRLTTSYIALRRVSRINLAEAIWEACMKGILPDRVPLEGQAEIIKEDPKSWGLNRG
jgi:predicted ATP-grasp superfamily ATP-dependent carboligase